mmetsp:Transcript_25420/g.71360  ORF Transcript_25420/g.71360 Transcript_25420/m.71360 type:complete len:310 (-) Transcript_25420:103-1032(-)
MVLNSKWLPPPPGAGSRSGGADVKLRLFCVPSAGMGGWSCYAPWLGQLPPGVELLPLELPSRGMRMADPVPYAASISDLAQQVLEGIGRETMLERPFVLFGHSFGAWIVYEMCQELIRRAGGGWPLPLKVYVSACRAPHLAGPGHDADRVRPTLANLAPDEFWEAFERRYGQNPDLQVAHVREFVRRVIQADFQLLEAYEPSSLEPLPMPLCALSARGDARCPPQQLTAWGRVAGSEAFGERWFEDVLLSDGWATEHRYVIDNPGALLRFLSADVPLAGHGDYARGGGSGIDGPLPAEEPDNGRGCAVL